MDLFGQTFSLLQKKFGHLLAICLMGNKCHLTTFFLENQILAESCDRLSVAIVTVVFLTRNFLQTLSVC